MLQLIRLHREGSDPEEITERDADLLIQNNYRDEVAIHVARDGLRKGQAVYLKPGSWLEKSVPPGS